jgi:uncharacterized protein YegP (UPF0339 family)
MSESLPNFEVYKDAKGEWRWSLRAPNRKIVADSSEGYTSKQGCLDAVQRIREFAPKAALVTYDGPRPN